MKFMKKLTALALCAACVLALAAVPVPSAAAETVSTFPDVTDPQVGRAVEALRMMGVIDGSGGLYDPDGDLTRAQFCKMAILVMGKGDEADAQANRTIFNDVPGNHWARGYVNLAATMDVGGGEDGESGSRLMMGLGNGSFAPDRAVTYAEAVTILLRILGYAKEANLNWPTGAVATAASVGLDGGFTPPAAGESINRAQAALLLRNMLTAPMSGVKGSVYLQDAQGCTLESGALLLVSDTTTQNGQTGAVRLFAVQGAHNDEPVASAVRTPASFLEGTRGTAVFNSKGQFLTFLPDANSTSRTITVSNAAGGVLTATDGTRYTPSNTAQVWKNGEHSDYAASYTSIQPGTSITVCFTDAGTIDYLFLHGTSMTLTGGTMVARDRVSGNPFAQLTAGTTDYKIVKNGVEVSTSALKQYDVASFDPTNKTLYVTDFRLTGIYESVYPNTSMPTKIKISLFKEELDVLDCAVEDLKGLKLNSGVTLLLSPDGKVAGAVSSSTLRSNTVGYVEGSGEDGTVRLLNMPDELSGLTLGAVSSNLDSYRDCLFTVTGTRSGSTNYITLSRLSNRSARDALNMNTRMLGGARLADNVAVFDRVANSGIQKISLSAVTVDSVPASKIVYQRTNSAGEVDLLLLNDVTGDLYTYGIVKTDINETDAGSVPDTTKPIWVMAMPVYEKGEAPFLPADGYLWDKNGKKVDSNHNLLDEHDNPIPVYENGKQKYEPHDEDGYKVDENGDRIQQRDNDGNPMYEMKPVTLTNKVTIVTNSEKTATVIGGTTYRSGQFIGLAVSVTAEQVDGLPLAAASVELKSVPHATPANFNLDTGRFFSGSVDLPVSDDVQCYNAQTRRWFDSGENAMENLNACLSFSSDLTVYYDRDPGQGGKVRVVVAN